MSFEFLADPNVWLTLVTLSALEIVLGIDNLVFISIAVRQAAGASARRGPQVRHRGGLHHAHRAAAIAGVPGAHADDLFSVFGMGISVRDLVLILGGVFLLVKGSMEIRELITGGR